jgi:exocyst complex component 6
MKEKIVAMNDNIQEAGSRLVDKKKELMDNRRKLVNIELGLESLQSCLFVLDICSRVSVQIANRKYFSALRMIQELQSAHLKLIHNYSFSKQVLAWLPVCQQSVRNAVLKELKDWFMTVKECAYKVGKLAMDMTVVRHEKVSAIMANDPALKKRDKKMALGASMEMAISEELEMQESTDAGDVQLDFTSLFQCIHIHDVLGKRSQLKLEFEENRKLQADQVIKATFSLKGDTAGFEKYMQTVAGFFLIEATVMTATHEFRSRSSVDALWDVAINKMGMHMVYSANMRSTV